MKRTIWIIVILVIAVGAWYAYSKYNETYDDLTSTKADFQVSSSELLASFAKDTASANKQYADKVVAVTGTVKSTNMEENPAVVSLGESGEMSSVQCVMDSTHVAEYKNVKEGDKVTIKGICAGGKTEDLFGTDVILNRSVLVKQ